MTRLARDYPAALEIFRALLVPINDGEIHLGEHEAAEKRIAGVTGEKRWRHYAHAAQLVADCAAVDPTPDTAGWVASIRDEYRRYPALQRELRRHLGRA